MAYVGLRIDLVAFLGNMFLFLFQAQGMVKNVAILCVIIFLSFKTNEMQVMPKQRNNHKIMHKTTMLVREATTNQKIISSLLRHTLKMFQFFRARAGAQDRAKFQERSQGENVMGPGGRKTSGMELRKAHDCQVLSCKHATIHIISFFL